MPVAVTAGPALASSPGQVTASYSVTNLTQNNKYSNQTNANACDEVEYSVRMHNPSYSAANNVVVKASLPAGASKSNTSNMTVSYTDGVNSPAYGSVTVNFDSAQSISYVSGSGVLYDGSGNVIKALPDGITNSGVNVGSLNGSTVEYVNFKAKVNCPTPECKTNCTPPVCKTNCTPTPPTTPPTATTTKTTTTIPTTLVNTGPGDVIGAFSAVSVAGALGYRLYLSRRLARQ
ncbi:MAG: hypothetical protein ACREJM_02235 [Candidatus Saccharimonadales bacterium]